MRVYEGTVLWDDSDCRASLPPAAATALSDAEATMRELALLDALETANEQPQIHVPLSADDRYRALIDQVPAIVFYAPMEGGLREAYVSPQIESILGFSQQEWLENPIVS